MAPGRRYSSSTAQQSGQSVKRHWNQVFSQASGPGNSFASPARVDWFRGSLFCVGPSIVARAGVARAPGIGNDASSIQNTI